MHLERAANRGIGGAQPGQDIHQQESDPRLGAKPSNGAERSP
jgi:hypothetical protein